MNSLNMILAVSDLTQIGLYILYILVPLLVLYVGYLILTKAFRYMGFSSLEAIIIVFISFIFGFDIVIYGFNISNVYLFSYDNWRVGVNIGGAVLPVLLSVYLIYKKKLSLKKVIIGVAVVTVIAFLVTNPDPTKGIISHFPFWLLPAFSASIVSITLLWKEFRKAAPLAYISGTLGVLIGADFLHLPSLLNATISKPTNAVIGGAVVFDMIYITGILAVIVDGIIMFKQRSREKID
jgi:uncharacterized membrane protein